MNGFILAGFLGPTEIIIILLVVVLLFGGRKIPELMKGLGQGMKEFKKATKDDDKGGDVKDPDKLDND
jgi:sec-independent protein translocase protein TatA